ncbi:hypothetical protein B5F71_17545, partial [Bacteroides sp. An269]
VSCIQIISKILLPFLRESVCKVKAFFPFLQIFRNIFSPPPPTVTLSGGVPFGKRLQRYAFLPELQATGELFLKLFSCEICKMLIFTDIYGNIYTWKKLSKNNNTPYYIYNNRKPKARIQKSTYMNGGMEDISVDPYI